jgi:hypothetical protein
VHGIPSHHLAKRKIPSFQSDGCQVLSGAVKTHIDNNNDELEQVELELLVVVSTVQLFFLHFKVLVVTVATTGVKKVLSILHQY